MDNQKIEKYSTSNYIILTFITIETFLVFSWFTGLFVVLPYYLMNLAIPIIYLCFLFYYYNLAKKVHDFNYIRKTVNIFTVIILILALSLIFISLNGNVGIAFLGLLPIIEGFCVAILVLLFFRLTMFMINKFAKKQ